LCNPLKKNPPKLAFVSADSGKLLTTSEHKIRPQKADMYNLCLEKLFYKIGRKKGSGQKIKKFRACPITAKSGLPNSSNALSVTFYLRGHFL